MEYREEPQKSEITVALVGNPNVGKTSLFNRLTGRHLKVGNWDGVTISEAVHNLQLAGKQVRLLDLPGVKSVVEYDHSIDASITRNQMLSGNIDLIVNVVDAQELSRQLYLTTQLTDLNKAMLLVISRADLAGKKNIVIDGEKLALKLGCPVLIVSADDPDSDNQLKEKITQIIASDLKNKQKNSGSKRVSFIDYLDQHNPQLRAAINDLSSHICSLTRENYSETDCRPVANPDFASMSLLEGSEYCADKMASESLLLKRDIVYKALSASENQAVDTLIASMRYRFVDELLDGCITTSRKKQSVSWLEKADQVMAGRFGFFIFLLAMYMVFFFTITVGGAGQELWDAFSDEQLLQVVTYFLSVTQLPSQVQLIIIGTVTGVSAVISFVPLLFVMHFCIGILEQSGYMARAVFSADHMMGWLGLHGKALIPFLLGFGCNVPAIESGRTLESVRERRMIVMMNPFVSCGARLPVYTIFAAVFFPQWSTLVIFLLYLTGIMFCILTGWFMQKTLLSGSRSPLIMSMPELSMPSFGQVLRIAAFRASGFIKKAGRIIVPVIMVMSVLNADFNMSQSSHLSDGSAAQSSASGPVSLLEKMGRAVTPVFYPIGISAENWPATVALLSGFLAKEVIIGTLNGLYGQSSFQQKKDMLTQESAFSLPDEEMDGMDSAAAVNMKTQFGSEIAAFSYLLFVLLYAPCVAVMSVIYREAGAKWMLFSFGWSTILAYSVATVFYQTLTWSSHPMTTLMWLTGIAAFYLAAFFVLRTVVVCRPGSSILSDSEVSAIRWVDS